MSRDPLELLSAHFTACAAAGHTRKVWWRDDDATRPGPKLQRLMATASGAGAPLSLAVIPARVDPALLPLCATGNITVLQHGIAHTNHQASGKPAELGDAREPQTLVDMLVKWRQSIACAQALPVLVPPWNRMRADLLPALASAGYAGVSLFGGAPHRAPLIRVDTHIDPIAWRSTRSLADDGTLCQMMARAVATDGPIGLLTHHIVHDAPLDRFVEAFADLVAGHDGAEWVSARSLFRH
ncbi:MAG: polysaccharide deacetylase [Pseudomonadota bacterium]